MSTIIMAHENKDHELSYQLMYENQLMRFNLRTVCSHMYTLS